jgi:hypothetical protein
LVAPTGQHRLPRAETVPTRVEVSLDDLLGPLTLAPFPEPPVHGVITQAWQYCPAASCQKETAGVVHADGWTCGECLTSTRPEEADRA